MNNDSTRKRRVQKTLGLHYSRFYLIARCIDSLFRRKILENRSSAAPVEKVGLEETGCHATPRATQVDTGPTISTYQFMRSRPIDSRLDQSLFSEAVAGGPLSGPKFGISL